MIQIRGLKFTKGTAYKFTAEFPALNSDIIVNLFGVTRKAKISNPNSAVETDDYEELPGYYQRVESFLAKAAGVDIKTVVAAIYPTVFSAFNDSYAGTHVVDRAAKIFNLEKSDYDIRKEKENRVVASIVRKSDIDTDIRIKGFSFHARPVSDTVMDAIINATYRTTQKLLKSHNISSIVLYRGTKDYNTRRNTLESWTADKVVAEKLAKFYKGAVANCIVPAREIFALPGSGWGVGLQLEVIVLAVQSNNSYKVLGDYSYGNNITCWEQQLKKG